MRIRTLLLGCALLIPASAALAQSSAPFVATPVTVGTSSAQVSSARTSRRHLEILNQSATATIYCTLSGSSAVASPIAGQLTMPPLSGFAWATGLIPANAVNCIASASSTPATILE